MTYIQYLPILIPTFPLLGWLILTGLESRLNKRLAVFIANATVALSAICVALIAPTVLGDHPLNITLFNWLSVPGFNVSIGLLFDKLSLLMAAVITGVGFLVHLYSVGYMAKDQKIIRYFSYLNLFIFFMLVLVIGDSLLTTFIGWEGVGVCSYLLIGFWNTKSEYIKAAAKALIMNRIGDIGFVIAMGLILVHFGTLNYQLVITQIGQIQPGTLVLFIIGAALALAICGKSAQFPLYTWLPDAMAGPTPVSALIHAATMVTSGIYLVNRLDPLFAQSVHSQNLLVIIGLITMLIGGITAVLQYDLKKILAYSTVSQLGFMVIALGLGAPKVALFHMLTHAFFKALLFLSAGNVIHGLNGEQDIRKMGGLLKTLPITSFFLIIGTAALAGLPPLSGFVSKELILGAAIHDSPMTFGLLLVGSALTAFYMLRTLYFVVWGTYRGEAHPHESGVAMAIPLVILSALSIMGGLFSSVFYHHPTATHSVMILPGIPILILIVFSVLGVSFAKRQLILNSSPRPINGLNHIYGKYIFAPYVFISRIILNKADRYLSDAVSSIGVLSKEMSHWTTRIQSGNVGSYVILMLLAILGLILKIWIG